MGFNTNLDLARYKEGIKKHKEEDLFKNSFFILLIIVKIMSDICYVISGCNQYYAYAC